MVTMSFHRRRGDGKPAGAIGKLGLSLFFFFFFAIGSLFEIFILHEFARAAGQRAWQKAPCAIVASEVQERQGSEKPYVFAVQYRYEHGGREYEGSGYKRSYSGSDQYSKTQELVRRYPAGLETSCYVNPADPGQAVLRRDSLLIGLVFFFPLIFVLIGAGGIYFTWRRQPPEKATPIAPVGAAARQRGLGRFGMAAFFGIFAAVGGAMFYFLGIRPIAGTLAAESWVETPCKVLRAEVRDHDSDDGTTYSVYILYEYEFAGQTHKSDCYDFIGGSSSGYKGKARVVETYRSAERPVCYVNPRDPSEAVLKRGFHAKLLLALFPLPFLLIGVGGVVHVLRGKRPSPAGAMAGIEALGQIRPIGLIGPADTGRQLLAPAHSPKAKFVVMLLIALLWNGIVSGFIIGSIGEFRRGDVSWFSVLFMLPFLAVGVGLAGAAVYQFLALFNPRPTIELSTGAIPLGGAAEMRWSFSGQTSRIMELAVTLRGIEEARYRRGTDTHTDRNTFYEMELYRTSDPYEIATGQVGFAMPQDTMHSFEATNNKILWELEIHGSIKGWPDVKESFKINVAPGVA